MNTDAITAYRLNTNLKTLPEQELLHQTKALIQIERTTTVQILEYLHEIERRELPLRRGYGSTHDFVVHVLGYSSAAAYRRIQSMRAMNEVPEIKPAIESGELTLTQIAMVHTTFRKESRKESRNKTLDKHKTIEKFRAEKREILLQSVRKSTRETERILRTRFPEAINLSESRRRVSAEKTEIKILLSENDLKNLETLKMSCAHSLRDPSDSTTISKALELALQFLAVKKTPHRSSKHARVKTRVRSETEPQSEPQKESKNEPKISTKEQSSTADLGAEVEPACDSSISPNLKSSSLSRRIPKAWVFELLERSRHQCEFISPDTHKRCNSKFALQIDHRRPLGMGGATSFGNLQVLCGAHNRYKSTRNTG